MLCAHRSMLRSLTWVALCLVLPIHGAATTPTIPRFMGLGYRVNPHPKACPTGWVFISAEEWWRREILPPNGFTDEALDFGHVHLEGCWPQNMALKNGVGTVTMFPLLHQNPGNVRGLTVVDLTDLKPNPNMTKTIFAESYFRFADKCELTGGNISMYATTPGTPNDCRWPSFIKLDTNALDFGGLLRLSPRLNTEQPTDRLLNTFPPGPRRGNVLVSANLLADNNKSDSGRNNHSPWENNINVLGWGTNTNYTSVTMYMPPKAPLGGIWRLTATVDRLSNGSAPVVRHTFTLDSNFHANDPGIIIRNETDSFRGQLVLDLPKLFGKDAGGWHKIVGQGKALDQFSGSTNTGSLAMFFETTNGAAIQCDSGYVQTHPASNHQVSITMKKNMVSKRYEYTSTSAVGSLWPAAGDMSLWPTGGGGSQKAVTITYDLSFMNPAGMKTAALWLYVSATGDNEGATIQVWKAPVVKPGTLPLVLPCITQPCEPIGTAVVPAAGRWVEVRLATRAVAAALVCDRAMSLMVTVANAPQPMKTVTLAGADSQGAPTLLLTPLCGGAPSDISC